MYVQYSRNMSDFSRKLYNKCQESLTMSFQHRDSICHINMLDPFILISVLCMCVFFSWLTNMGRSHALLWGCLGYLVCVVCQVSLLCSFLKNISQTFSLKKKKNSKTKKNVVTEWFASVILFSTSWKLIWIFFLFFEQPFFFLLLFACFLVRSSDFSLHFLFKCDSLLIMCFCMWYVWLFSCEFCMIKCIFECGLFIGMC